MSYIVVYTQCGKLVYAQCFPQGRGVSWNCNTSYTL